MKLGHCILAVALALTATRCSNEKRDFEEVKKDIRDAEDEYYPSDLIYLRTFTEDLAKNARIGELANGEIRITWLPSFSDPSIVSIYPDSILVLHFKNGRDTFQSTGLNTGKMVTNPKLEVAERKVLRGDSSTMVHTKWVSSRIDTMMSIQKKGWTTLDGVLVIVNAKINGKENGFAFSEAEIYHDKRYEEIGKFASKIIRGKLN